jgi:DNA mismatch repair protein MutS2
MNLPHCEKVIRLLEFDRIREAVAECALSGEAARIIREEDPLFDAGEIRQRKNRVSAFCELLKTRGGENRQELPETGFLLPPLAVEGAVLDTDEVLALGLFVERGGELLRFIADSGERSAIPDSSSEESGDLRSLAASAPDCSALGVEIFRIIDRDGKVKDLPEIKKIRIRIQGLTKELEHIAGRYNSDENTRRMLQSELPSQRDGRLVLAVKANFRGRIKGIVHEVSSTGQTVFVEPEESVEKNNHILMEEANLKAEIRRLLRELTESLARRREELAEFHRILVFLECLRARARYSLETAGCFALDASVDLPDNAKIMLKQARHPLLGRGAVPIDLSMDSSTRMVIITGPNTGGKTVALKTMGLFALMNQAGLALPASEAALPLFDGISADIGDEQSIRQSLSTFSAHMTNVAEILKNAGAASLVLLDELGSGTDPEEGSAIAMAILDHLIEKKSTVVLTTHHGMLKNYGYSREGVENASVEFDRRTLSPTYRIIMGIPGESRALDIAARNGLPQALVDSAKNYLDEERSDVSALITGLKEKHKELDDAARKTRESEQRLREERRQADLKELSLRQREYQLKQEGAGALRRLLLESRKTLENLVREIREGDLNREKTLKVKEFIRDLEKNSAAVDAALDAEETEKAKEAEAGLSASAGILCGTEVLAGPSRQRGRVVRRDKKDQTWIVEIGSVRMSFAGRELIPLAAADSAGRENSTAGWAAEFSGTNEDRVVRPELKLLGMRLDEALEALRRQIDAAVLGGLREFSVVHGKGDGILQKGVHDFLKQERAVADYYFSRPGEGGFGRTEVVLKG